MAGNTVTLTFAGDSDSLTKASKQAEDSTKAVADSVTIASKDVTDWGERMGRAGAAAAGFSAAIDDAGGSLQALVDFQNAGKERAMALARAENDVEQAMNDAAQAAGDLKQAQEDLNQANLDGKQAAVDSAQAALDIEQANIDARQAQADYAAAVKEHGANSIEAQQAALDLKQAMQDLSQANLDAEQATRDAAQATLDGEQAQRDMAQAATDAKGAQLDLNEAQSEAHPSDFQNAANDLATYANVVAGVVGVIDLLTIAYNAVSISALKAAASTTTQKVATIAGTVATGIATAAQWLWNVALTANPIGVIIVAIGALVGVIIYLATQTRFFQTIWEAVWGFMKDVGAWFAGPFADFFVNAWNTITGAFTSAWDWIKGTTVSVVLWIHDKIESVVGFVTGLPGRIRAAASGMWDGIKDAFRSALNWLIGKWNSLKFTVPGFDAFGFHIGGFTLGVPHIPAFHQGGVVPGGLGAETLAVLQAGERVSPPGGSGSFDNIHVTVELVGDGVLRVVRTEVGKRGGDAQRVLGNVRG